MGDEEVFVDEEIAGGGDAGGGKTGFVPAAILKILKWVALGLAAVIFIVTVVVLTVTFIVKGPTAEVYPSAAESYQLVQPILQWYDIGEIRTRTSDENPVTVIVSVKIGYDPNNKSAQNDINQRREQIIDRTRFFFSQKREAQLNANYETQLKNELKEMVNGIVGRPYVRDVVFLSFSVMEF
jgi:flagellar protein FliL